MEFNKRLTLSTKLVFGKHKNKTVYEIFKIEPSYIKWLIEKWKGKIDYKITNWLETIDK